MNNLNAKIALAKWIEKRDPFLFETLVKRYQMQQQMNGLGFSFSDFNFADFASNITDAVKSVAPALVQYKAQSKILKAQLERAKQGQPPLDAAAYTPTVKVAAEVTPEMEAAATRVAQKSIQSGFGEMQKLLPIVGIGLAAVLLLKKR